MAIALVANFSITQRGTKNMQKNVKKALNPIAIWHAAAPPRARIGKDAKGSFAQRALNREKHAPHVFIHKHRPLAKAALASPPLNPPPPPPPIHTIT